MRLRPDCARNAVYGSEGVAAVQRWRIDHHDRGQFASVKGFPGFGVYAASKAALRSFARTWLNELQGQEDPGERAKREGQVDTPDSQRLEQGTREMFESLIPRGRWSS